MAVHCVVPVREFMMGVADENSLDAIEAALDKQMKVVVNYSTRSLQQGSEYIGIAWGMLDDVDVIEKITAGDRFVTRFMVAVDDLEREIIRAGDVGIDTVDDIKYWKKAWNHIKEWTTYLSNMRKWHSEMFGQV
jgi:hypothetical protein